MKKLCNNPNGFVGLSLIGFIILYLIFILFMGFLKASGYMFGILLLCAVVVEFFEDIEVDFYIQNRDKYTRKEVSDLFLPYYAIACFIVVTPVIILSLIHT